MKKIVLHIGFHKTASSSIQKTLSMNEDVLSESGFLYPKLYCGKRLLVNHSIPFYSLYCSDPKSYHMNISMGITNDIEHYHKMYKEQLRKYIERGKNLVISGEDISVLSIEQLNSLKNYFEASGYVIEVHSIVREPYSFTCSSLQQLIRTGRASIDDLRVISRSDFVSKVVEVFAGAAHFYNFSSLCEGNGPVFNFINVLGFPAEKFILENENKGISNTETRVMACLNKVFPSIYDNQLSKGFRSYIPLSFDENKFLLTQDELKAIECELEEERMELSRLVPEVDFSNQYPTSSNIDLSIEQAFEVYSKYKILGVNSKLLLDFIFHFSSFDVIKFSKMFPDDFEVHRDIAIVLEAIDIKLSIELMTYASELKPNGELILRKMAYYQKLMSNY